MWPRSTSVELAGGNNVVIRVGKKQSVVVKADDNLLDRVTTEVQSGRLVIGNTPGSLTTKSPMSVEIDVPTLDALTLTGSGNIVVNGIKAESLEVTCRAVARSPEAEPRHGSMSRSAAPGRCSSCGLSRTTCGQS